MNKKQQVRLAMNRAVLGILAQHQSLWKGFVPFERAHKALAASIAGREEAATRQAQPTEGVSGSKQDDHEEAVQQVTRLAQNAAAYAVEHGDTDLSARLAHTRGSLVLLPDETLVAVLQAMLDAIQAHAGKLKEYRVSTAAIGKAQDAIDRAKASLQAPRTAIVGGAVATQQIGGDERHGRQALTILDKLVGNFTEDHPAFVAAYKQARIVVDKGGRSAAPEAAKPDA